jgi:hypothetical protein
MKASHGLAVFLVALGAFATAGCRKSARALGRDETRTAEIAPVADAAQTAVGHYNKGFNLLLGGPQQLLQEYFAKFPKEGPEAGQTYTLVAKHDLAERDLGPIKEAFAQGARTAPASLEHLAPLASACTTEVDRVIAAFKSAHDYWGSDPGKGDRPDKGKRGKLLHADFVAASDAYRASLKKFESALSALEDEQMGDELRKYEAAKSYGYWFRCHNQHANKLLKADKAGYAAAFAEVERAHAGLVAFAGARPNAHAVFKTYRSQADQFLAGAQKLKAVHESSGAEAEAASAHNQLIDAYNAMIEVTNSLRELEANDLLHD